MARNDVLNWLKALLGIHAAFKESPQIADEAIDRPLFIAALPRSGSSILFELLSLDPDLGSPLQWEMMFPYPPPEPATRDSDPRIDVCQHLSGDARHAALGVAHGRRRVAVHGAEVALAIDHGVAHAEGLRQPHHRVVDGRVAVRVIHAHGLTDHLGALGVLLVELQTHAMQGVKDSAMDRLEAVSNVGEGTSDDDRHGVVEIRPLHLIFNVDRDEASSWAFGRVAVAAVGT